MTHGREKAPEDIVEDILSRDEENTDDIFGGTEVDESELDHTDYDSDSFDEVDFSPDSEYASID